MIKIGWLFNRKKNKAKKPKAVAFVDYEHWYISMDRFFHTKPDIKAWVDDITLRADVREILFFGDFSNPALSAEIPKIRSFSSRIIETRNANPKIEKDFTDFIMLDYIYQRAHEDDTVDMFILFTGDAHFNSVSAFLKTFCHKDVGIFGVRNAFSMQLKQTATWWEEVPLPEERLKPYFEMILKNMDYLEQNGKKNSRITLNKTVEYVASSNRVGVKTIREAMDRLVDFGYVHTGDVNIGKNKVIQISADWKKVAEDGIYSRQTMKPKSVKVSKPRRPGPSRPRKNPSVAKTETKKN